MHEKHRKLYRLIDKRDREITELFDPLKHSAATMQLLKLYLSNRITDDDVMQFSEELGHRSARFKKPMRIPLSK